MSQKPFISGVIEGFYGTPWTLLERLALLDQLKSASLNTYLYAPKDDLKHRSLWRELYSAQEADELRKFIGACQKRDLGFIYALSPGLDIHYADPAEFRGLTQKFEQLLALGVNSFALLFDDIPDALSSSDREQFTSFASAQAHIANSALHWLTDRCSQAALLFCPTAYCGRMASRHLGGENYLATLGKELLPEIDIFWTGPEIISREITVSHLRDVQNLLQRKPILWDNLHANDYDGRRFFCGPYSGRDREIFERVGGILVNPNSEFPLNYPLFRTLGRFIQSTGGWRPREEYLAALHDWRPRFENGHFSISEENLVMFFDCYYLPYEEGAEAEALYGDLEQLLASGNNSATIGIDSVLQRLTSLREFCVQLSEMRDRSLFYALSRRIWELREELDLLERYIRALRLSDPASFRSDFHLPGTYRGGFVPRLQQLLIQNADGSFSATSV
ncbi:MAG TPA: beta-N-acetylglucosaminidase domain-containing protein [Verrucomicrobiae bacterium]|nr:beta-N-acetylglucosaminidase domain-containing protein [Verrucomicrobiae bacterium]